MSGFLQRLVVYSRPSHAHSIEHSVRPRIGSRFEPAHGMHAPAPVLHEPFHEEEVEVAESISPPSGAQDVDQPHKQPVRTITTPTPPAAPRPEPSVPSDVESVERAREAGTGTHDTVQRETPTPPVVRPRQQSVRTGAEAGAVQKTGTKRRSHPVSDAQPAPPASGSAAPRKRDEAAVMPETPAEEVIRTIRVVQEAVVSLATADSALEPAAVPPVSDKQRSPISQPITQESQTPLSPEESPRRPVRTRTERAAEPIRPQIATEAPSPPKPTSFPRRREPAEPPTIRVTIGRIEVRAEQSSQPAPTQTRRQPARRRPALSLDDYLAKRNEGGR